MLCVLLGVAYMTLLERKVLSYVQLRKGPNKVGIMGLLQPISDAVKLFLKEFILPMSSNLTLFTLLPCISLILNLSLWHIIPSWFNLYFIPLNVLIFLCLSALNVYVMLGAGWASNSTYAFLGGMRASAQTISYEISLVFILFIPLLFSTTLNSSILLCSYPLSLMVLPLLFMWFTTCLAETNRAPFDFAEGESELVSGFNIEYGGGLFALLFLAEYTSIMFMSVLTSLCFLPSFNSAAYMFCSVLVIMSFLFIRGVYPRHRYDMLMMLCWKTFLPVSLSALCVGSFLHIL
uniref:NADH-ubiquinone oxidoreductase chain 1 n=1 Tax=Cornu aspersum TaxID=6535 RepID=S4SAJ0_CORAP|nr:NADH dehydrogenase subunit 1 [Cornu aspersum]